MARIGTYLSIHSATNITAESSDVPSLKISFESDLWTEGHTEITVFLEDRSLCDEVAAAITAIIDRRKAKVEDAA